MKSSLTNILRAPAAPVHLSSIDPEGHPGFEGDKESAEHELSKMVVELAELQERLFANGYVGDVVAFHMLRHGVGFIDAAKALGAWVAR